ncbi:hypothetical protein ACFL54_03370 [Planctomycetota bacterium]
MAIFQDIPLPSENHGDVETKIIESGDFAKVKTVAALHFQARYSRIDTSECPSPERSRYARCPQ